LNDEITKIEVEITIHWYNAHDLMFVSLFSVLVL